MNISEVLRHLFVPDVAWALPNGGDGYRIDRQNDPANWAAAVHADDTAIVTQIDDGQVDVGTGKGAFTSSLSAAGIVRTFLERLDVYESDRVLEIGTGTGYTAALLSAMTGSANVTSIEVDPNVMKQAAINLERAGFSPNLIVGDAATVQLDGGPFDRVHVTCGVTTLPYGWVRVCKPGAIIVFPWMPEYEGGYVTVLTVTDDGKAIGRFHGGASYMMLRSQRGGRPEFYEEQWRRSETVIDPRRIFGAGYGCDVTLSAMFPDISAQEKDGEVWLWSPDSKAHIVDGTVSQFGPRDLWRAVESAYFQWVRLGSPDLSRFGISVKPEGQFIWIDDPSSVVTSKGIDHARSDAT